MELLKDLIKNKKCLKLICGAGNENVNEIEKLVYVFSKSGFNVFDVCAKLDVVNAAKNGLRRSCCEGYICVSVGIQSDIHVSKAVINKQKCNMCFKCYDVCPHNAIFEEDNKLMTDEKNCLGCMRCLEICDKKAIIFENKYKAPYTMLLPLISENIDYVEFHCSSDKKDEIIENWHNIKSIYHGMLGICLDRSKLGDDSIINLLKEMIKDNEDYSIVLQTDGRPMSGNNDDYKSTLQTVAFAELIRNENLPVNILLSGGTNSKSTQLAKETGIEVNGAALGSYARKLVEEYINNDNFFEDENLQNTAINKAKELADNLLKYLN